METIQTILLIATPLFAVFVATSSLIAGHKKITLSRKRTALLGRIVKLSPKYRAEHNIIEEYGKIEYVQEGDRIDKLELFLLPSPKAIKEQKKKYDETFKESMKHYRVAADQYQKKAEEIGQFIHNPYGQSYLNPPQEPQYNFAPYQESGEVVSFKSVKLMPKNFDYINKTIIKTLSKTKVKGGDKKVKKMPRLFRFALYLALVVLVWDVVVNANSIVVFIVQHFITK